MNASRLRGLAAMAIAALTGCGGLAPQDSHSLLPTNLATVSRERSWMLPEAKSEDLLYVTTSFYGTYVFAYPSGKIVGILLYGPGSPEGLCVDRAGDVFMTGQGEIAEFAHGGTKPIAILRDYGSFSYFDTYDCSIDPTTGNLAATKLDGGDVVVFRHARGNHPMHYYAPHAVMFWCVYDGKGNLFADLIVGKRFRGRYIAELPKGTSAFKLIRLSRTIGTGALQWDGKYLAIGDSIVIYRVSVAGSTGTIVGSVPLGGAMSISSFWLEGKTLIGADELGGDVGYWRYPAGGSPYNTISGVPVPLGTTVSLAK